MFDPLRVMAMLKLELKVKAGSEKNLAWVQQRVKAESGRESAKEKGLCVGACARARVCGRVCMYKLCSCVTLLVYSSRKYCPHVCLYVCVCLDVCFVYACVSICLNVQLRANLSRLVWQYHISHPWGWEFGFGGMLQ